MAHERQEDQRDVRYSGGPYPRSADASQSHLSENEHMEGPPQSTAPLYSQYLGYAPWNAPQSLPGVPEPCYAVSCTKDSAPGFGAWDETRHTFFPVPVMSAASRYTDQGAGNAGGAITHHWDNGNPTGATCVYAPPLASNTQTNRVAGEGPTPAANVHSGAGTNAQPCAPAIDAPVLSESLGSLARRLILDLGTRVNALNMEASGRGGLKVTITLETADIA